MHARAELMFERLTYMTDSNGQGVSLRKPKCPLGVANAVALEKEAHLTPMNTLTLSHDNIWCAPFQTFVPFVWLWLCRHSAWPCSCPRQ